MAALHILLAPDKFKGTLSAEAVCDALAKGLQEAYPSAEIQSLPLADGGDGTLAVLRAYMDLQEVECDTVDPIGKSIRAQYLVNEEHAFIELASASGIVLLPKEAQNPLHTSTYGTGLMIKDAIARGKRHIFLLLGGSATNDMGFGIASALGIQFEGATSEFISGGDLGVLTRIRLSAKPAWQGVDFTLLCDVNNPLYGPNGAAHVYAKQKGASPADILRLDEGMRHASSLLTASFGEDVAQLPGAGAAGGIAGGLVPLLGAKIRSGFQVIAQLTKLEEQIAWADVVFTGEGQLDSQSLQGKVVGNVLELCVKHKKPCHIVVGRSTLAESQELPQKLKSISTLVDTAPSASEAMENGANYLTEIGRNIQLD